MMSLRFLKRMTEHIDSNCSSLSGHRGPTVNTKHVHRCVYWTLTLPLPAAGSTSTGGLQGPQPTEVQADTWKEALKKRPPPDSWAEFSLNSSGSCRRRHRVSRPPWRLQLLSAVRVSPELLLPKSTAPCTPTVFPEAPPPAASPSSKTAAALTGQRSGSSGRCMALWAGRYRHSDLQ